jgi:ATP-binding cassette, subfamily A (ABC1), member 3
MTTSNPKKFLLLLWKNWVIQKRHPIQTVVEIALPVLFCSLLILIRVLVDPGTMQPETHYTPLNLNELPIR